MITIVTMTLSFECLVLAAIQLFEGKILGHRFFIYKVVLIKSQLHNPPCIANICLSFTVWSQFLWLAYGAQCDALIKDHMWLSQLKIYYLGNIIITLLIVS